VIPSIIVPVVNRPDLLDRLLASIDHPVRRVTVIDNGDCVDTLMGGRRMLSYRVRVVRPGWNLGVAASWNLGIKGDPHAAWWLIVNSDIEFGPGDLARIEASVDPRAAAVYKSFGYAVFAVTPPLVHEVGWFDEGYVLGYDDDVDYDRRVELAGLPRIEVGFTGTHVGSASIQHDPGLRHANASSHPANDRYYAAKWGGGKQGGETYNTPFNRGGSLREWDLDIIRLRQQIWPGKKED
jgi:GT2 family glycosyltransferase